MKSQPKNMKAGGAMCEYSPARWLLVPRAAAPGVPPRAQSHQLPASSLPLSRARGTALVDFPQKSGFSQRNRVFK